MEQTLNLLKEVKEKSVVNYMKVSSVMIFGIVLIYMYVVIKVLCGKFGEECVESGCLGLLKHSFVWRQFASVYKLDAS